MVKYDKRFQQKVVDAYLAGEGGYRRIDTKLRNHGYMVNSKKILRLMRKLNL